MKSQSLIMISSLLLLLSLSAPAPVAAAATNSFGNSIMQLTASSRTAGAIDSLIFNGKQFINNYDHGRELSVAWRNDTNVSGECDNPTEPGSISDGAGATSTSQIQSLTINSATSTLTTVVVPAYWTAQNQVSPGCPDGVARGFGGPRATDQVLTKTVQVGYNGDPHVLVFDMAINNQRTNVPNFQIEAPTGYLTYEFTQFYKLNPSSRQFNLINMPQWQTNTYGSTTFYGSEEPQPAILATADGKYAMGVYSASQNGVAPSYALFSFPNSAPAQSTNKWSVVFRPGALKVQTYHFKTFVVVGTLADVEARLLKLSQHDISPITNFLLND